MMMYDSALAEVPQEQDQSAAEVRTEYLPFTVRSVHVPNDVARAARLRQSAYARHLPQFAAKLQDPEAADSLGHTVILLAESKLDGKPLATMRIHTNVDGQLPLEQAVSVPDHLRGGVLAEAVRLAVVPGREGHVPRDAIFKAFYLACVAMHVDWMVICARHPLHKMYQAMHFTDTMLGGEFVPLPYAADIPHRVLNLQVNKVESTWKNYAQPLYKFFFETLHPDIENFHITCRHLAQKILEKKTQRTTAAVTY